MINLDRLMAGARRVERRKMAVRDARGVLGDAEVERLFPAEVVAREALRLAENEGWVARQILDT